MIAWKQWFRWTRVRFRPYRAAFFTINAAWARMVGGDYWRFTGPARDIVDAQWRARRFEEGNWNTARRRAWHRAVASYPHGVVEGYIGGPLVIP